VDFEELVERAEAILDPVPELLAECGETTELSFPTPYSSAVELPKLIFESKWVGPIHVWPRWPSVTMGRKKITSCSKLVFKEDGQGAFITTS
jgi:hypothetical protein